MTYEEELEEYRKQKALAEQDYEDCKKRDEEEAEKAEQEEEENRRRNDD